MAAAAVQLHGTRSDSRPDSIFVQAIKGVEPIVEGYNPATWMLEVTGSGYKHRGGDDGEPTDFAQVYQDSALSRENEQAVDDIASSTAAKTEPLQLATRYAATRWQQIVQVTRKLFLVYWCASWLAGQPPAAVAYVLMRVLPVA